jgi:UDP-glucose 4-epimerase
VVIVDNLSNSNEFVLKRIEKVTGIRPALYIGDVRDRQLLRFIFRDYQFEALMHFAGLKAVSESEEKPLLYFDNNVSGSVTLFDESLHAGIKNIIFSSSATVYGNSDLVKYSEDMPLNPINVYGRTKRMIEDVLRDVKKSNPTIGVAILRYFNPVGAHESGLLGESPNGIPNNLMPYIADVALGIRDKVLVYGNDYLTPDGTGLRDYIHVQDLVLGHIAALKHILRKRDLITLNLGTGVPHSVIDIIKAFEIASGKKIPFEFVNRRTGDLPEYYADPSRAENLMNWRACWHIHKMCEDTWRWQLNRELI